MDYTTRQGDAAGEAHVNYDCPCGCTAGVIYQQDSGTQELGQCCCGRLLWVGEDAESRVASSFENDTVYNFEYDEVGLPWGQTVQAVLAVPHDATHGAVEVAVSTVHDPVCHMDIDPKAAAGTSQYHGVTYYFCARGCKLDFDEDPEAVLQAEALYDHSGQPHHMMTSAASAPDKKPWWQFWR